MACQRPWLLAALAALVPSSALESSQSRSADLSLASAAVDHGAMVNRTTLWSSLASSAHCSTGACVVPAGAVWVLDASMDVETLTVHGVLRWDTSKDNLELRAEYILVTGHGRFEIGSRDSPMLNRATIYIKNGAASHNRWGFRFFSGDGSAEIEIHGRPLARTWTLLSQTAPRGAMELHLKDDPQAMGWRVGDRLAVATTSRGYSTVHRIASLAHRMVHLDAPLPNEHWGGWRQIVDQRFEMAAEVANLERSVLITGDHEDFYESRMGLHTSIHGNGFADIRYTRVEFCGQRDLLGRYCLHFHRMGHCPRCVFKGNAVHDSQQVGITIHGTHFSRVEENTVFDSRGVGMMTEDGNEMNNTISRNVLICSWYETCSQTWLGQPIFAGIFLIGMTNDLIENRVAGYENCIWTPGAYRGLGIGAATNRVCPAFTPYGIIRGNVNHDCWRFGLYLDDQHPRNIKRDSNGFLIDHSSCNEFTADGKDNGLSPANVVEDEFDWHNMFVGQYALGDVQFVNYTSVNNAHGMYWKSSKNFADGRAYHIVGSRFYNDPTDYVGLGKLDMMGPAGPFVFGIADTVFAGGPAVCGAICAGQACGLGGAGGPCNVQYLLHGVDFSRVTPGARRVSFGIHSIDQGYVLPMFVADDDSLGGHRSLVSKHLNGFGNVPGCGPAGHLWGDGYGCDRPVRRLNVWGRRSDPVKISGPGYDVAPTEAAPVHGMNAGRMEYEPNNGQAYGMPVLVGETYTLEGSWLGDMVIDFSDTALAGYFNTTHESVRVQMAGVECELRASDDRRWLSQSGIVPRVLDSHTSVLGGRLHCGGPALKDAKGTHGPLLKVKPTAHPGAPLPWTVVPLTPFPECKALPKAVALCSDSGCKAQVGSAAVGVSCAAYCARADLTCAGAWDSAPGSCKEQGEIGCEEVRPGHSGLICECATLSAAAAGPTTTTTTTTTVEDRATFLIKSRQQGHCLQEPHGAGEQLTVALCDHMITGQQWTALRGEARGQIRSVRGFCMEGTARGDEDGVIVARCAAAGGDRQLWTHGTASGLIRGARGQCVDASPLTAGALLRECGGGGAQWDFIELAQPASVARPPRLAESLAALPVAGQQHVQSHASAGRREAQALPVAAGRQPATAGRRRRRTRPGGVLPPVLDVPSA